MIAEERFGPYTVYECVGAGGMATVHRASIDRGDGVVRDVALKRLLPQHVDDKTFVDDFVREGQIASRLHHPGIVSILDLGKVGPTHFIAMELVKGQSMMQLIRAAHVAKRPAPIGVVIALISELCDALDYACNGNDTLGDRLNIIHRDLSPSNLLVADDGHLRVIDFGVAKAISGRFATTTGLVKGKLGYMSIEALAGKALDGRADVFSTGVVAWELLTGRRLFTGANEMEIVQRVRSGAVTPPSAMNAACPPTLDSIVQRALARSRDDRWATAADFRDALEQIRRAYREDSTVGEVKRWRDAVSLEPTPRATRPNVAPPQAHAPVPAPPPVQLPPPPAPTPAPPPPQAQAPVLDLMESMEDADEVTQHRAVPFRVPPRPTERQPPVTVTNTAQRPAPRAGTEMDLLDLEPPEASAAAQTTFEARAYEPPDEDPLPTSFDFGGDAPSRTYTGQIAANAFGGPTAQTHTVPGTASGTLSGSGAWPESATQLNLDPYTPSPHAQPYPLTQAYPPDGPSSYVEIIMQDEPQSIRLEPPPETPSPRTAPHMTVPHMSSSDLDDVLDLDAPPPPRDDVLDLEAPPPPRDEFLDLEADMTQGFDAPTNVPTPQPRPHDTVIGPPSQAPSRRKRS